MATALSPSHRPQRDKIARIAPILPGVVRENLAPEAAVVIRPLALGALFLPRLRQPLFNARWLSALAGVAVFHGILLAGLILLEWAGFRQALDDFEEIPVEIVEERDMARPRQDPATALAAPLQEQEWAQAPSSQRESSEAENFVTPPHQASDAIQRETEPAQREPDVAQKTPVEKALDSRLATSESLTPLADQAAADSTPSAAAAEQRRRIEEKARNMAEDQREKRRLRAMEAAKREKAAAQRAKIQANIERQASQDRQRRAAAQNTAAFDAASYGAIVRRVVAAAISRSCPSGAAGRVGFALVIGASGQVASVSLSSSSGNGAQDQAALAAVRRAGPFPAPVGRSSVHVPIGFTCRGG